MRHHQVHRYVKAARAADREAGEAGAERESAGADAPGDNVQDAAGAPADNGFSGDNAVEEAAPSADAGEAEVPSAEMEALCRSQVCPRCPVMAEAEDQRLRAAAEMENFKRRLAREHEEMTRYAAERVLRDILPALDSLDLALRYGGGNDACRDMLQGVEMTRKLLLDAVAGHGLSPVGAEGEDFTPELHEAVGFEARPDLGDNVVARVLQHGYRLGDRLLRPARVMIARQG